MRIRKIELNGFKSFPERTVVEFGQGISCVVGPNGSGKSNILDAIKWVIGEQSARAMRGGEMADVIFAGSAERPPSGFAEVALTLCAHDGEPFPGEYARLSELQVGRRLHRTGASEYFLNQSRCRRRDIVDLFLDTGVATDLYCFIEQGSVGKIVHATPAERRALIEEAAGISRYKARRDEAEARLQATATQLDRAADVADEMGRRLRGLEREVVRAARWRRLRALVRQDEIVLGVARYADLAAARRTLRKDHREAVASAESASRQVARRESDLAERRAELEVVEAGVSTRRDEVAELDARLREDGATLTYTRRRVEELAVEADRLATESAEVDRARADAEEARAASDTRAQRLISDLSEIDAQLAEARTAGVAAAAAVAGARAALDRARDVASRRAAEQAASEAMREELGSRCRALDAEVARRVEERDAARARAAEAVAMWEAARAALVGKGPDVPLNDARERHDAAVAAARQRAAEAVAVAEREAAAARDAALAAATADRDAAWDGEARARDLLAEVERERASLVARERELDGLISGLEHAISADSVAAEVGALTLAELAGAESLADQGLVGALGFRLDLPVVRDAEQILALSSRADGRSAQVLWLPDGPAGASLVPGTTLVDTLAQALAHHRQAGGAVVVRGSGERVDADGVVTVGDPGAAARARVERRRERDGAATELAGVAVRREALDERRESAADALRLARRAAENADAALRDAQSAASRAHSAAVSAARSAAEAAVDAARSDADAALDAAQQVSRARAEADRCAEAVSAAESRLADVLQDREAAAERLAALEPTRDAPEAAPDGLSTALSAAEQAERAARDAVSDLSVRRAALAERLSSAKAASAAAAERGADLGERADALEGRRQEVAASRTEAETRARELDVAIARSTEERAAAWDALQVDRERLSALKQAALQVEASVREATTARDEASRLATGLEVRVNEVRVDIEGLKRRIDERYLVSLPGLLDRLDAQGRLLIETDERAREDATIGGRVVEGVPDHPVTRAHLADYDGIAARVERLEERRTALAALGEVSLGALDEYEDVRARHHDLVAQQADLEASVAAIRKAIAKMNRTCRQRFRDTFDRVTEELSQLYPRLTGGGTARLALTDEEDLLQAGVEVYVQPPGKRLQNLGLLSGGEKAMTAIAVLLSLFTVKPSPFCVLDEVDAPLDEANGARFNEVLRAMAGVAQFILITHNRKTMECADTLYGITMSVPGVSSLVSVRLGA